MDSVKIYDYSIVLVLSVLQVMDNNWAKLMGGSSRQCDPKAHVPRGRCS